MNKRAVPDRMAASSGPSLTEGPRHCDPVRDQDVGFDDGCGRCSDRPYTSDAAHVQPSRRTWSKRPDARPTAL